MYFSPNSGGTAIVFIARIEGSLTADVVQQALCLPQKRHLLLQVHILEGAEGAYFQSEGTPEIPLSIIDKHSENQWIEIAEKEVHEPFRDSIGPLCRVMCLQSPKDNSISEIIATLHHVICDALSGLNFIDQILSLCQQIIAGEPIAEGFRSEALPLEALYQQIP